jgi:hypothetical protein
MAHYAWDGNNGFVKNPLLTLDSHGQIVDFETVDPSVETAGVEFFSGLLLPCLLEDLSAVGLLSGQELTGVLNRCNRDGSSYVLVSDDQYKMLNHQTEKPVVLISSTVSSDQLSIDGWKSSWEMIKESVLMNEEPDVHALLRKYVYEPWLKHGLDSVGGTFSPGKKPGVALIQHINWHNMSFLPNSQIRIIAYPA